MRSHANLRPVIGMTDPDRPDWADAFFELRDEMQRWIEASLSRQEQIPYRGGHDEGTFIASWFGHHLLFGEPRVLDFARYLRDGFAEWSRDHMLHGFYREGEAHHQTEIYTFFLSRLWQVAPDDRTAELILDAAHHIGNWVEGYPDWYDWDERRFLSWQIGTERVGTDDASGYEVPDHFRLIQIALVAHRISGQQRYLDLCTGYADRWAKAILEAPADEPPTVLRWDATGRERPEERAALGAHHHGDWPLERVEPHVPAGTIDVMLDLYALTGEQRYAYAARRLCEALLPALADPYSNPPGALLMRYRATTGDLSLDDAVLERLTGSIDQMLQGLDGMLRFLEQTQISGYALAAARLYSSLADNPFAADRLEEYARRYHDLVGERPATGAREETPVLVVETLNPEPVAGIGKRRDMVRWAWENRLGGLRPTSCPPPPSLVLAWQITRDDELVAHALRAVGRRVGLARRSLRDGRHHGCAGTSIGAVASGHGRDGGYGNVTGAFYPAAGLLRDLSVERPIVRVRQPGGAPHLPPEVAMLVRPDAPEARLYNDSVQPISLQIALGDDEWLSIELAPREVTRVSAHK